MANSEKSDSHLNPSLFSPLLKVCWCQVLNMKCHCFHTDITKRYQLSFWHSVGLWYYNGNISIFKSLSPLFFWIVAAHITLQRIFFLEKNEWGASIKASGLNDEKGSCLLCPGHEWSHANTVPALMGHTVALCTTVPTLVNEIDTENLPQCKGFW